MHENTTVIEQSDELLKQLKIHIVDQFKQPLVFRLVMFPIRFQTLVQMFRETADREPARLRRHRPRELNGIVSGPVFL